LVVNIISIPVLVKGFSINGNEAHEALIKSVPLLNHVIFIGIIIIGTILIGFLASPVEPVEVPSSVH
jgi:hypothetical protein